MEVLTCVDSDDKGGWKRNGMVMEKPNRAATFPAVRRIRVTAHFNRLPDSRPDKDDKGVSEDCDETAA